MTQLFRFLVFVFCLLAVSAHAADSPLHSAARGGWNKAEVEALIAKGADVNAKDTHGDTPLHTAAFWGKGRKYIAELLLAKGADVNARDKYGNTPLHVAAEKSNVDVAELLLAKGADANAKAANGDTPLYMAVSKGNADIAKLLLAKDVDINARGDSGSTLLHTVAFYGKKDIAELLLANGADVNARNERGNTPLHVAEERGNTEVAGLLKEQPVKQARLLEYIKSNPRAALVQMTSQLKDNPDNNAIRRLIIKLASELKPAPAIPEEARKHFVEGAAIVKAAKNPAQQALAAQSFTEALKIVPWWGDAYYNLGAAQELAEKYDAAEQAFSFYLLSNPGATEKREVQDRIYALSAKRKLLGAK